MIQSLIRTFKCPYCSNQNLWEQDIHVMRYDKDILNLDIWCPKCKKHFMMRTELVQINASNLNPQVLKKLQHILSTIQQGFRGGIIDNKVIKKTWDLHQDSTLKDEQIVSFQKELSSKKDITVEDLFWNK